MTSVDITFCCLRLYGEFGDKKQGDVHLAEEEAPGKVLSLATKHLWDLTRLEVTSVKCCVSQKKYVNASPLNC